MVSIQTIKDHSKNAVKILFQDPLRLLYFDEEGAKNISICSKTDAKIHIAFEL